MATSKTSSPIYIRLLTKHDLEFVRKLRNINKRWFFHNHSVSQVDQLRWFDTLSYDFYIICLEDDTPIGTISEKPIGHVELVKRRWVGVFEIGNLMMDIKHRGKGYMTEALRQVTSKGGFFVAHVKKSNISSLNVFKRGQFWDTSS